MNEKVIAESNDDEKDVDNDMLLTEFEINMFKDEATHSHTEIETHGVMYNDPQGAACGFQGPLPDEGKKFTYTSMDSLVAATDL